MAYRLQLLFFMIVVLVVGCRKEEPSPELLDPIYSDLLNRQNADQATLASEKKKLSKAADDIQAALPNTLDLKNALRDRDHAQHAVDALEQKVRFDTIRADRRRAEDKFNYHEAFVANKDWPDKQEYQNYLTNMRLMEAPRSWDAHLPKLFDRKPAAKPAKKAESEE